MKKLFVAVIIIMSAIILGAINVQADSRGADNTIIIAADSSPSPRWNPTRQVYPGRVQMSVALFKIDTDGFGEDVWLIKIQVIDEIQGLDTFQELKLYNGAVNIMDGTGGINSKVLSPNKEVFYDIFTTQTLACGTRNEFLLRANVASIEDPLHRDYALGTTHHFQLVSATFVGKNSGNIIKAVPAYPMNDAGVITVVEENLMTSVSYNLPSAFAALTNYPNPFNPSTAIDFNLPEAGNVAVEIYNVSGQKVASLADGFMSAGRHSIVWNAKNLSAGIYFCILKSEGKVLLTQKMTLLK